MWQSTNKNHSAPRYRPVLESLEDRLCPAGTVAALTAPTLLSVTPLSATAASVAWTNVANETGYTILLWNGSQAVPLTTVAPNVTTVTVGGLPAGQQVWLRVEAFNGTSHADSAWQAVNLPVDALAGAAGVQAKAASPTEIDLHWTVNGHGQTGFKVLEWNGTSAVTIASLPATARTYAATGLTPATTYYFSIESFDATTTTTTDWATATTPPTPIKPPTHLTATATDTQVTLSWTAGQGATGYRLYEWENGQAVQIGQTDAHLTTATVNGLTPGTGYWFYVQAFNDSNTAATAWKWVATTAKSNPLLPPTNVTAHVVGSGKVEVDWTDSVGAVGYWVYDWTGTNWHLVASAGATDTSAVVKGVASGTHYFAVMAYTENVVQYATSTAIKVIV